MNEVFIDIVHNVIYDEVPYSKMRIILKIFDSFKNILIYFLMVFVMFVLMFMRIFKNNRPCLRSVNNLHGYPNQNNGK